MQSAFEHFKEWQNGTELKIIGKLIKYLIKIYFNFNDKNRHRLGRQLMKIRVKRDL